MSEAVFALLEITFVCKKCGKAKPFSEFPKEPRNRSGFAGTCKACFYQRHADWAAKNPNAVQASREKWDAANPGGAAKAREDWITRNPDKVAANLAVQRDKGLAKTKTKRGETWGPRQTVEGRRCSGCLKRLPRSAFGKLKSAPDKLQTYCRPCMNARAAEFSKNLEPTVKYHRGRKSNMKRLYGITIEAYEALVASQGGRCAICRGELSETGKLKGRNSHVDHDHETGAIRGVLCRTCNVGIGHMKEDVAVLQAAIDYLNRARGVT